MIEYLCKKFYTENILKFNLILLIDNSYQNKVIMICKYD